MLMLRHAQKTDLLSQLSARAPASGAAYLSAGRLALSTLLADPRLLDNVQLERIQGAYTRNIIFGDDRITVSAMVWAAGSRTSIHDHHCSCCYAILSGALQESWYDAIDDAHVVKSREFTRRAGEIVCMLPTGPNLHQMVNTTGEDAISIHIYGYDYRTRASSIGREYVVSQRKDFQ